MNDCKLSPSTFTLIHGTIPSIGPLRLFSHQQWIEDGSACRSAMCSFCEATFIPFRWSGRNSHAARLQAGKDLAGILRQTFSTYTEHNHYIIAHSHGGNVILYALKELSSAERQHISRIVTLGTPFIRSSRKDVLDIRQNVMLFLGGGCIVFCILALLLAFDFLRHIHHLAFWQPILCGLIALAAARLFSIAYPYSLDDWQNAAEGLDQALDAYIPSNVPILCIATKRDEAANWLSIWDITARLFFNPAQLTLLKLLLTAIIFIFVFIDNPFQDFLIYWEVLTVVISVLFGLGLLLIFVMISGLFLTVSSPWGFGQTYRDAWLVNTEIKDTPDTEQQREEWFKNTGPLLSLNIGNRPSVYSVESSRLRPKFFSFHHSWLHDDKDVMRTVGSYFFGNG